MKSYKIAALILMTLSFSIVKANETGYEVELIIFEDTQSRYSNSEDWTYNDMLNTTDVATSTQLINVDPQFKELEWSQAKLAESLERIKSNSRYTILINKRWKQTGLDRDKAYYMEVTSLNQTVPEDKNTTIKNNNTSAGFDSNLNNSESIDIQNSYIQGRVKLIMSRYLHFEIKLDYFKKSTDVFESNYSSYPIVAERRMKSREIHYLDHPMVGVIVHASPFKIEPKVIAMDDINSAPIIKNQ